MKYIFLLLHFVIWCQAGYIPITYLFAGYVENGYLYIHEKR